MADQQFLSSLDQLMELDREVEDLVENYQILYEGILQSALRGIVNVNNHQQFDEILAGIISLYGVKSGIIMRLNGLRTYYATAKCHIRAMARNLQLVDKICVVPLDVEDREDIETFGRTMGLKIVAQEDEF
ncbi:unnamed protein product [Rhodiola kirilowii]